MILLDKLSYMLNSNINKMEDKKSYTFSMPINTEIQLVCKYKSGHELAKVYMAPITFEQELILRRGGGCDLKINNKTINIYKKDIYCFGEFLIDSSEEIDAIEALPWFEDAKSPGAWIPSNYDYNTHTCVSDINRYRFVQTWHPYNVVQYKYACLGKPERIILFSKMEKWKD